MVRKIRKHFLISALVIMVALTFVCGNSFANDGGSIYWMCYKACGLHDYYTGRDPMPDWFSPPTPGHFFNECRDQCVEAMEISLAL